MTRATTTDPASSPATTAAATPGAGVAGATTDRPPNRPPPPAPAPSAGAGVPGRRTANDLLRCGHGIRPADDPPGRGRAGDRRAPRRDPHTRGVPPRGRRHGGR